VWGTDKMIAGVAAKNIKIKVTSNSQDAARPIIDSISLKNFIKKFTF